MDLDKLSSGEKIAGVSSIVLFIFMFFDWFTYEIPGLSGSGGLDAWNALDWIPIVLVVTIVAALGVAVLRLIDSQYEPPVSANSIVAILGGISFLLILFRIIDTPGLGGGVLGDVVDSSPAFGIFVSLVAAAGIAYGGYKAMQEEGVTFSDLGDRFSGGGGGPGGSGGGDRGARPSAQQPPPAPPASQAPPPPPPPSDPPRS